MLGSGTEACMCAVRIARLKTGKKNILKMGGAVCTGRDQDDAEAVCMVMEKGAMAALLKYAGHKIHTIDAVSGLLEHIVYTAKYAKLK